MYAKLLGMTESQYKALEIGIVPRAGKLPSDLVGLTCATTFSFGCPVKSVDRRMRADHIACLISEALVEAGV